MVQPCIADIKIGKRHYGMYTSAEKRKKQTEKAAKTTSMSLGIRLCGMQVYKETMKKYTFLSKYEGRKLTPEQVSSALVYFLSDGQKVHVSFIHGLLNKLIELRTLIQGELRHFRMYASSILLLYDAEISNTVDMNNAIQVKQIDFEHCYAEDNDSLYRNVDGEEFSPGPDTDYIEGLNSLIEIFKEIYAKYSDGSTHL